MNIRMHILWQKWVSPSFLSQNYVHPQDAVIFVCPLSERLGVGKYKENRVHASSPRLYVVF